MKMIFIIFLATIGIAKAAPPENADPKFAPWFEGLRSPATGNGCCSQADCRPVESRTNKAGRWEVFIDSKFEQDGLPPVQPHWMEAPPRVILKGQDNPIGRGVACWRRIYLDGYMDPKGEILCFVLPYLS
jgi:hypothetical protein